MENAIGRKLDLRRLFLRWNDDVAQGTVRADVARGRTPILSVPPERRDGTKISWAQVASGPVDADIAAQARTVASLGAPVSLSFHHEPHIETLFGTPAEYVAACRHYVAVFRATGVPHAALIMTPSGFSSASVGAGAHAYYPGDDVVDPRGRPALPRTRPLPPARPSGCARRPPPWTACPRSRAVSYFHTHGSCPWWLRAGVLEHGVVGAAGRADDEAVRLEGVLHGEAFAQELRVPRQVDLLHGGRRGRDALGELGRRADRDGGLADDERRAREVPGERVDGGADGT